MGKIEIFILYFRVSGVLLDVKLVDVIFEILFLLFYWVRMYLECIWILLEIKVCFIVLLILGLLK